MNHEFISIANNHMDTTMLISDSIYLKHQFYEWLYSQYQLIYSDYVKLPLREQLAIIWHHLGYSMTLPDIDDQKCFQITRRIIGRYNKSVDFCQSNIITIKPMTESYLGYTLKDALKPFEPTMVLMALCDALIPYSPPKPVVDPVDEFWNTFKLTSKNEIIVPF